MKSLLILFFCIIPFIVTCQIDSLAIIGKVDSMIDLAEKLRRSGKVNQALLIAKEASNLSIDTFGNKHFSLIESYRMVGICHHILGDFYAAEIYYNKSLEITEIKFNKNNIDYIITSTNLAVLYQNLGMSSKAEQLLLHSRNYFEKKSGKESSYFISTNTNLGNLYTRIGEYQKAERIFYETKQLLEKNKVKNPDAFGRIIVSIAILKRKYGLFEESEKLFLEACETFSLINEGNNLEYAATMSNLGDLYRVMGNYQSAEKTLLRSKNIFESNNWIEANHYGIALNYLAILYTLIKDYDKAEKAIDKTLNFQEKLNGRYHRGYTDALTNKAILLTKMKRYKQAKQFFLEAHSTIDSVLGDQHPDYFLSLINLSNFYWTTKEFDKSISMKIEGIQLQNRTSLDASAYLSERELFQFNQLYIDYLDQFFALNQTISKPNETLNSYSYNNILFHKGFLLNSSNQVKKLALKDSISAEKYNNLKSYRYLLSQEYSKPINERKNLEAWETEAQELEKELIRTVSGFGEALQQVTWKEVQSKLKPREAAIEFVRYRYYNPDPTDSIFYSALVLLPEAKVPYFVPLFEEKELTALLSANSGGNYREINNFYLFDEYSKGEQLYHLIWQPLEKWLNQTEKIYFSPAGLLHRLNMGAIPINSHQVFSEQYVISRIGSTRQLVISNSTPFPTKDAAIFGGIRYKTDSIAMTSAMEKNIKWDTPALPDMLEFKSINSLQTRGKEITYLQSSKIEALQIAHILHKADYQVELDTGYYATEEKFKQLGKFKPSPRIVHISTHGNFFPDPKEKKENMTNTFEVSNHPMVRSILQFAGSEQVMKTGKGLQNREDGVVTAYEVSQMDLSNTQLAVLSACETGLGDIEGNEGVYGLQRAFKIAGTKYLIMSLWQVYDTTTADFMSIFYYQLPNNSDIPTAFYDAQKIMRAKHPNSPYHWAGFVLVE